MKRLVMGMVGGGVAELEKLSAKISPDRFGAHSCHPREHPSLRRGARASQRAYRT